MKVCCELLGALRRSVAASLKFQCSNIQSVPLSLRGETQMSTLLQGYPRDKQPRQNSSGKPIQAARILWGPAPALSRGSLASLTAELASVEDSWISQGVVKSSDSAHALGLIT